MFHCPNLWFYCTVLKDSVLSLHLKGSSLSTVLGIEWRGLILSMWLNSDLYAWVLEFCFLLNINKVFNIKWEFKGMSISITLRMSLLVKPFCSPGRTAAHHGHLSHCLSGCYSWLFTQDPSGHIEMKYFNCRAHRKQALVCYQRWWYFFTNFSRPSSKMSPRPSQVEKQKCRPSYKNNLLLHF